MLTKDADKKREQIQLFCMDDMVPQDHLLRIIDKVYITTDSIHLHGQTVPLQRENRTTFTEGVPLHINFL